jgi:hypothetical protein
MKKLTLIVVALGLAGCSTDSAQTLSRDYRTLNNEAIDALMMITSESRARFAHNKILKRYQERLGEIDKRMTTWLQNTDDKDIIVDTLSSESVFVLLAECKINQERLALEQRRLQKLVAVKVQDENERRRAAGEPAVDASKVCPAMSAFAEGGGMLGTLDNNLKIGTKFGETIPKFLLDNAWKKNHPPNMEGPGGLMDLFNKRMADQQKLQQAGQ